MSKRKLADGSIFMLLQAFENGSFCTNRPQTNSVMTRNGREISRFCAHASIEMVRGLVRRGYLKEGPPIIFSITALGRKAAGEIGQADLVRLEDASAAYKLKQAERMALEDAEYAPDLSHLVDDEEQ